jgi:undecaprenyl-diphosphatase
MEAHSLPDTIPQRKLEALVRLAIPVALAVAALAILLFAWIANEVFLEHSVRFDLAVRAWIHQYSSPALTRAAVAVSFLGEQGLFIALIISLPVLLYLRWRKAAAWLLITVAGSLLLNVALKHAFHRSRPDPFFGSDPMSYSFPSGHAMVSFCFYGVLAGLLMDRIRSLAARIAIWLVAAFLVSAIGLSRIYLGVHYPTDVLAGYLAGAVWVTAMIALDRLRLRRRNARRPLPV